MTKVRVVRILTYTGTPEWVAASLDKRTVVGDTRNYIDPAIGIIRETLYETEVLGEELPPCPENSPAISLVLPTAELPPE